MTRRHVSMPDKHQADIVLGLPGPPFCPDYLDASLMNTILGVFGMMGRIGQTVREQGLLIMPPAVWRAVLEPVVDGLGRCCSDRRPGH